MCHHVQNELDEDKAVEVSQVLREWLEDKTKSLDYIYKYDPPSPPPRHELSEGDVGGRVCDPYITVEDINPTQVEEILSLSSSKRLKRISGRCAVKLRDGTEILGSWRDGVRQGQGSLCSPHLEKLGVDLLAGSYTDGRLTGVARLHMKDGSIREGWFINGVAEGPFKGDIKVCSTLDSSTDRCSTECVCRGLAVSGLVSTGEGGPRASVGRQSWAGPGWWAGWTGGGR